MQVPSFGGAEAQALHGALQRSVSEPLEDALGAVESGLEALACALRERETRRIDLHARELHLALAHAMEIFTNSARHGGVPRELRHRLMMASGQVAAQRNALARATAALDRAMEVLIPREQAAVYAPRGF